MVKGQDARRYRLPARSVARPERVGGSNSLTVIPGKARSAADPGPSLS